MPSLPTLRERGLPANVSKITAKTLMEGGLDVRARRLDDDLYCLTEMSAHHVATSHFYHDSY